MSKLPFLTIWPLHNVLLASYIIHVANNTFFLQIYLQITTSTGAYKYIQLQDGSMLPIVDTDKIVKKLDDNNALLMHICNFVANMELYISKTNPADNMVETLGEKEKETCARALKIDTGADLLQLEAGLKNASFGVRLLKYCKSLFKLTGKREGRVFFKTFMRTTINPHVFTPYSWQGNSRTSENESFKEAFPKFIDFVQNVVVAADYQHTKEDNEKCFQNFLRAKNEEIKRFNAGGAKRSALARKRKQPAYQDEDNESSEEERDNTDEEQEPGDKIQV